MLEALRCAKKVGRKAPAPATLDTAGAVARFELSGGGGKIAMADDKGRPIHVNIRRARVGEREVIQVSRPGGNFDAGCGRIGVELEARVGNASLLRTHTTVDGDIAPVAARPEAGE